MTAVRLVPFGIDCASLVWAPNDSSRLVLDCWEKKSAGGGEGVWCSGRGWFRAAELLGMKCSKTVFRCSELCRLSRGWDALLHSAASVGSARRFS